MQVCSLIRLHRANKQKGVAHLHSLCVFLNKSLQPLPQKQGQRERRGGGGRAPRSWSAHNFQHEPFSSASWPSCRARGHVHVPPFTTAAHPYPPTHPTRRKSLPNSERTRSCGCSRVTAGLRLRRKAHERHILGRYEQARTRLQTHNHLRAVCLSLRGFSV